MELKSYINPLIKWWWLLALATSVAAASSFFVVQQQPSIYQSKTTLLIGNAIENPNPSNNEFWLGQQLARAYTDIGQRGVVRNAVMEALELTWLPEYSVRSLPNTQLIEIAVNDTSPERAAVVANELANQLILRTPTSIREQEERERQAFIDQQLDELQIKIQETQTEITSKQDELAELFSASQISDTKNQIRALEDKLDTLQGNYGTLLSSTEKGAVNSLSVMEPATVPSRPIGPDVMETVVAAAAIALSLAAGAAYLLEYIDDTIKSPEDVEKAVKLPTLAGIASLRQTEAKHAAERPLVTLLEPRSPISEAYRTLRTGILFANIDKNHRSLMVTSATPGEGKSSTVANLAVVMAQAGHSVLLIDADLRRPTIHQIFNVSKNNGLTNVLLDLGRTDKPEDIALLLQKAQKQTAQKGLSVLTCGNIPPNPSELIGSERMRSFIAFALTQFDYVIFDTPPCLAVTDAVVLSTLVDGTLMVTQAGRTRRNQIQQTIERLQDVQANLLGVVLNRLTARTGGHYYYYYYDKNAYHTEVMEVDGGSDKGSAKASGEDGLRTKPKKGFGFFNL